MPAETASSAERAKVVKDPLSDSAEFEAVYRRYAPSAFRRARRILGDEGDAREVVHDVFLRLLERPDEYRGDASLTTFLYSAVTHACLNRMRSYRNRMRLLRERWLGLSATPRPQRSAEALSEVRSILRRMPEPLGEVAIYCYVDELSHEETAKLLGCSRRQIGYYLDAIAQWAQREELRTCRT